MIDKTGKERDLKKEENFNDVCKWKYNDKTRDTVCLKTYTHRSSYMFHIKARQRQILNKLKLLN